MIKRVFADGRGKFQIFLFPFYFLVYMMLFYDHDSDAWSMEDFNKSVKYKTLEEIFTTHGEPSNFEIRGKFLVLDYEALVHKKMKSDRYPIVRLMILNSKDAVLLPSHIYYKKK